ncbi:MAG TPA: tetratricopeptide repeat protein [Flavobacterium sp.]|nr:hypothetical protein [Flavobacterium sp.]HRE78824.1 tetratricopeptide repeat protein [Flavobacterium sp.]
MKRKLSFCFPILFAVLFVFNGCEKTAMNKTEKNHSEKGYQNRKKAETFLEKQMQDSAFYYFNLSKEDFLQKQDSLNVAYNLLMMAQLQKISGDYNGCEATTTEALPFLKADDTTYLPEAYNLIGMCHQELFNYAKAIEFFSKAILLSNDKLNQSIYKNNRAVVYNLMNEHTIAKSEFEALMSLDAVKQNQETKARVIDNYGFTLWQMKNLNAIDFLNQGFSIRTSIQDHNGLVTSNYNLGEFYAQRDKNKAISFLVTALKEAKKINNPDDQLVVLKLLYQIENDKSHLENYVQLSDSISKVRQLAKNQFASIKYDFFRKNQALLKLEKANSEKELLLEKTRNRNLLMWFVFSFAVLSATYYIYALNQKRKRQIQEQSYRTETRISKRIHDELANDVFTAMTFTQTQNLENPISKEALLDNLEHIYQRTRDISKENSDIRTDENYEPDLFGMIDGYGDTNLNVIRKVNEPIHWQKITPEKKITLQRVLQEFLINTKKHSEATVVIIDFSEDRKNISVTYTDNGIGLKNTQQRKSGLQNAENRILAVKGNITFDNTIQKGFKVTVVIPK